MKESFTIEKTVPLLPYHRTIYPFPDMEVGDSFACANGSRVSSAVASFSRHNPGKKFSVRKVDGGYRCWRTA